MGKLVGRGPHTATTFEAADVRSLAVAAETGYGDATPAGSAAVQTTLGEANEIMEPGLPSSSEATDTTPVILVPMQGSFTATGGMIPQGAAVPPGTTLTVA
jgi:hypothetical protein